MAKQFTLGKSERLKSRKLISQLFNEGKGFSVYPFRVNYLISKEKNTGKLISNLQFGVSVSSRNFKKATDRNRIKRLLREAWRLQKRPLQDRLEASGLYMTLFLIYNDKELPDYWFVYDKVTVILKKLEVAINENNSPNT